MSIDKVNKFGGNLSSGGDSGKIGDVRAVGVTRGKVSRILGRESALQEYAEINPINEDLVRKLLDFLSEIKKKNKDQSANLRLDWYDFLTSGRAKESSKIEIANLDLSSNQAFIFKMFNHSLTAVNLDKIDELKNAFSAYQKSPVRNYVEMLEFMRKFPEIQKYLMFKYQDGLTEDSMMMNTDFIHIKNKIFGIPAISEYTIRIYLTPKWSALAEFCDKLLLFSEKQKIPLYFKTIDLSVNKRIERKSIERLDRVIIYTNDQNFSRLMSFVEDYFEHKEGDLVKENITAAIPARKGISIASEVTEEQKNLFPYSGSFNSLRAKILEECCEVTMIQMLLDEKYSSVRPRSGRTLKEIFVDFLAREFGESRKMDIWEVKNFGEFKLLLNEIFAKKFDFERISANGWIVRSALMKTFYDVLPNYSSEFIVSAFRASYGLVCEKYRTDRRNIALNGGV